MVIGDIIFKRYTEMKSQELCEALLAPDRFGDLRMYINLRPEKILLSLVIETDHVFLGAGIACEIDHGTPDRENP